jgi:hypothetical protein
MIARVTLSYAFEDDALGTSVVESGQLDRQCESKPTDS